MFIVFERMSRMEFAVLQMNLNQIKPNYLSFHLKKTLIFVRFVSKFLEFELRSSYCMSFSDYEACKYKSALENVLLLY